MTNVFFVAGCQRSGTTLMRLILGSHSQLKCYDEAVSYQILSSDEQLDDKVTEKLTGFKIPRFTEQLLAPVVDDPVYNNVQQFYSGEAPILFIVRNVLDVISSMRSLGFSDGVNWINKYAVDILKFKMKSNGFSEKYRCEINFLEKCDYHEVAVGALYWKYKNDALFDYMDAKLNLMPISYEKLVSEPDNIVRSIADFLGVPFEKSMLMHHEKKHDELEDDGKAIGGTIPTRAISTSSIGNYHKNLSGSDIQLVTDIVGGFEGALTYALNGEIIRR